MLACRESPDMALAKIIIPPHLGLKPGDRCFIRGRLIGLNNPGIPTFQCNPEDAERIPMSRDLMAPIDPNRVYVEGLGIVVKREELKTEPALKNPPIVCTVKHNDWDQAKQADITFKVRYIISPTTLLKSHALIQKGCEVSIAGYLVNTPSSHEPWLVETTGVNVLKNPPRCRKKELKIPKNPDQRVNKKIAESLPRRTVTSPAQCSCEVDRGEGSSSGATPHHGLIQAGASAHLIPNFSKLDIKGKSKEISLS